MLIKNHTSLSYEAIGQIIDKYRNDYELETIYYGKQNSFSFRAYGKIYDCVVTYLKSYVKYDIMEAK